MNKLLVALYDTQGYMKSLADYLGKKNFLLDSRLFTKSESLNLFLKDRNPDVLLLGQDVDRTELQHLERAKHLVIMSEGNCMSEGGEDYPLIFKYQSAENILKEIFRILEGTEKEIPGAVKIRHGQTEFLGIYRPYGANFPVQRICPDKEEEEKKSLFVNMEILSGLSRNKSRSGQEEYRGLSELIFYLKQRNEKLALKLKNLLMQWENMDYVGPVEDFRDLYSICRDDVDRLLAMLANETGYGRVVFDVGFLTDASLYLLYCCDGIYIPKAQSLWEENQKNALERLLLREGLEDMIENIHYVAV